MEERKALEFILNLLAANVKLTMQEWQNLNSAIVVLNRSIDEKEAQKQSQKEDQNEQSYQKKYDGV